MRKFKCESDFMAESKRIYRAYVEEEKKLKGLIDETNLLKDLTNEAKERETKKIQQEISEKRAGMKTLLSNLENDFADWAFEFADLTGEGLDRKLATALCPLFPFRMGHRPPVEQFTTESIEIDN